jgi:hypothetical protein
MRRAEYCVALRTRERLQPAVPRTGYHFLGSGILFRRNAHLAEGQFGVTKRQGARLVGTAEVPHIPDRIVAAPNTSPLCQDETHAPQQRGRRSSDDLVVTASVDRPLIAGPEVKALCVGLWPTKVRPSSFPLNLPIDDNPDSAADRKQVLFFTKEGRLCDQTPTFAAGAKISPRIACLDVVARRFVRRGVRAGSA